LVGHFFQGKVVLAEFVAVIDVGALVVVVRH